MQQKEDTWILCNNNHPVIDQTRACYKEAEKGHLIILEYLHERGYKWDHMCTHAAAQRGHLECLKYLYENGCNFHPKTCEAASYKGYLECIKYAHENVS